MRYTDKQFLTADPDESGSVICKIETPLASKLSAWTVRDGGTIDASISIRDCHGGPVVLDFSASNQKSYEKRVAKLDKMLDMVTQMRQQYIAMWENHQRDIEWKKKEKPE